MHGNAALLTLQEMAYTMDIQANTLNALVQQGIIPHTYIQIADNDTKQIRFNPHIVFSWLQNSPNLLRTKEKTYLDRLRMQYHTIAPDAAEEIKGLDAQFKQKRIAKGYTLTKVTNKKLGFVYYVRYIVDGKTVPSRWCTHTNNEIAAAQWALENRERLLAEYLTRKEDSKKPYANLYAILKKYYDENSQYLQTDKDYGRIINEKSRITYHNFVNRQFIPFLRSRHVKTADQIDAEMISDLRKQLRKGITSKDGTIIRKGIMPQTINHYISYVSLIFDHLVTKKIISYNPCKSLLSLKIGMGEEQVTGCYETDRLKGVFNKRWKDRFSLLLNMVIYTTNMRNSEIENIQVKDLIVRHNTRFIDIPASKSENGVRIVPLHDFVYRKLMAYIQDTGKGADDYLFRLPTCKKLGSKRYKKAYLELAYHVGYTDKMIRDENISFYSGRHFWKTLMNENGLGDIEEYFMGHKIPSNVAARYNHRDKQKRNTPAKKAKEVFAILDRWVFKPSNSPNRRASRQ